MAVSVSWSVDLPRPSCDVDAPEKITPDADDGITYHRERYFRDGVQAN